MAPKRKSAGTAKAAAKAAAAAQKLAEVAPPLEDLKFLTSEANLLEAFYRIAASDPCRARRPVQEENSTDLVPPGSFPNPYLAIDLNDKQGVWQKETALSKALGQDPAVACRHRTQQGFLRPAGLRNLGATCYLNSLLQYLFFNLDFRYSFLRAPAESKVVATLQEVFALLAEAESLVVDPKDFITAARVDALEQADATEFSALLLDWLQRELCASGGAAFIPALFEGGSSTIVQCSQDHSHFSEKPECFMELRAGLSPVAAALEAKEAAAGNRKSVPKSKGGKKAAKKLPTIRLEQILEETAFPEEILDGSNQWLCPRCDRKVDARRSTRLTKLPPYLHITVERYHFDVDKEERKRLAHPVSFPRRLELRLGGALARGREATSGNDTATLPVAYECIGYLEHVSDSAHSGHYRATLLREDEEPYVTDVAGCDEAEVLESATKRQKVDGPDAAAGAPQKRSWWRLDDETVTTVTEHEQASCDNVAEATEGADPVPVDPARIESATAYLVLYRRCDHDPGQLCQGRRETPQKPRRNPPLSEALQRCVDGHNTELRRQRKEFESNSLAVERFVGERRRAVTCLAEALRQHAVGLAEGKKLDLSFVPAGWLERFLRGEDRTLQNILEGDASIVAPTYAAAMLKGPNCPVAIDPLSIWCGEVKLLPTAALAQVGGQHGGLDSSTLLQADEAMNEEVAQLVFKAFKHFSREFELKAKIQGTRYSVTEVRNEVETAGQDPNIAVWVSLRQLNRWRKAMGEAPDLSPQQLWRHFVQEVREYRFGTPIADGDEASDEEVVAGEAPTVDVPPDVKEVTLPKVKQLTFLGGLLCSHGLVCRPRAAALVSRADLEELLQVSEEKDRACRALWGAATSCRPRLSSGLRDNELLSFGAVCNQCRGAVGGQEEAKRKAAPPKQAKRKAGSKEAEREGSAFNNSVFLSSATTKDIPMEIVKVDAEKPPLLE